jgi:hypothetical protein
MNAAEQDLFPFAAPASADPLREQLERNEAMLKIIALGWRPCISCGKTVYFTKTRNGKVGVWNVDARPHFATCPAASDFRREEKP